MSMGLSSYAAKMHNLTPSGMKHTTRTLHGESAAFYTASPDKELEGTSQGSGGSPGIWASTVFFVKGIKLFDAEQIIAVCLIAVFFVDDGMPEVNNAGEDDQIPEME
jgi:hypothetical protein